MWRVSERRFTSNSKSMHSQQCIVHVFWQCKVLSILSCQPELRWSHANTPKLSRLRPWKQFCDKLSHCTFFVQKLPICAVYAFLSYNRGLEEFESLSVRKTKQRRFSFPQVTSRLTLFYVPQARSNSDPRTSWPVRVSNNLFVLLWVHVTVSTAWTNCWLSSSSVSAFFRLLGWHRHNRQGWKSPGIARYFLWCARKFSLAILLGCCQTKTWVWSKWCRAE